MPTVVASNITPNVHFTYRKCNAGADLEQGDVLAKTQPIVSLIDQVHPHYGKDDYTHFLVLTQSCDLVKSRIKARYLTLAAIRPLALVVDREIQKDQKHSLEQLSNSLSIQKKARIHDFLVKLLNNNDSDYFYLHQEPALEFNEPSCAFLRLSVAIRAEEHYEKCVDARIFGLNDTFKAKLGWLIGDLYSRVGTDDWVPTYRPKEQFKEMVAEILDGSCRWFDSPQLEKAKKLFDSGDAQAIVDRPSARHFIDGVKADPKKERVVERVAELIAVLDLANQPVTREQITVLLKNDSVLQSLLR